MNKCHFLKELSSYLDNQLPVAKREKIGEHLKTCDICGRELSRLKSLSQKLREWRAPDLGVDFDRSVMNKIVARELERGEVKMKKKTLAYLIPSGVLAGILVFIFVGGLIRTGKYAQLEDAAGQRQRAGRGDTYYSLDKSVYSEAYHAPLSVMPERNQVRMKVMPGSSLAAAPAKGEVRNGVSASYVDNYAMFDYKTSDLALNYSSTVPLQRAEMISPQEGVSGEGRFIIINPVLPATGEGEKIIRTAQVKLEVTDGKETYKKANLICQELGGYLAASDFYKDDEGREAGVITMRIPKDKFLTCLERLSELGKVEDSHTQSRDVSQEYANLKTQLDAAMVVYKKMMEALDKKQTSINEAVRLESELTPILRRIEDLKNRIEFLNNAVSFTTVTVHFYEPMISAKVLKESNRYIKESILAAGINSMKLFAGAIPVLIIGVIVLVVLLGVAIIVKPWIVRLFKRG